MVHKGIHKYERSAWLSLLWIWSWLESFISTFELVDDRKQLLVTGDHIPPELLIFRAFKSIIIYYYSYFLRSRVIKLWKFQPSKVGYNIMPHMRLAVTLAWCKALLHFLSEYRPLSLWTGIAEMRSLFFSEGNVFSVLTRGSYQWNFKNNFPSGKLLSVTVLGHKARKIYKMNFSLRVECSRCFPVLCHMKTYSQGFIIIYLYCVSVWYTCALSVDRSQLAYDFCLQHIL